MRVHYFQHVHFESPAYVRVWLEENGHTVTSTEFFFPDYQFPDIDNIDALIVMGGPMSVHDLESHPWLFEEKLFIRKCIQSGKRVLGICLGAQLLAASLGASVNKAANKEIGWFTVRPTKECENYPWFYTLFQSCPTVFHWHGERFDVPSGSYNLLQSEANDNQAFCAGEHVIGLQFHLEMTSSAINDIVTNCRGDLTGHPYVHTSDQIASGKHHLEPNHELMRQLLKHWLEG
ncbi:MAG TPA: type 1 glutamine amidotransferase [Flavisolibacter sp.]|nr:type 1 glutamine amidotransferase [Flavisolibacter sp.]